jgi:hypothetical protein
MGSYAAGYIDKIHSIMAVVLRHTLIIKVAEV